MDATAAWHALDTDDVVRRLETDPVRGLSAAEVGQRLVRFGENVLEVAAVEPWWWKVLAQFKELVIWILLAAAGIAAAMGDWADTAAILAIVVVNAAIGFFQEERALRALAALKRLAAPLAKVVRDGAVHPVPARSIVPGDRIELEAGDQVPADARLVEAFGLRVQESALTGESVPVEKIPVGPLPEATPLGDRRSIVHAGTVVAAGRGAALVVETGMRTQLGRIASLLERSPL
jgi:Ca2+-transporting ATPase